MMRRIFNCAIFILFCLVFSNSWAASTVLYSEGLIQGTDIWTWHGGGGGFRPVIDSADAPEGSEFFRTVSTNWAGWGVFFVRPNDHAVDYSQHINDYIKFYIRSNVNCKVEIELIERWKTWPVLISQFGWDASKPDTWQEISIPIGELSVKGRRIIADDLKELFGTFLITAERAGTFDVDFVRWTSDIDHLEIRPANATIPIGMSNEFKVVGIDANGGEVAVNTKKWNLAEPVGKDIGQLSLLNRNSARFDSGRDLGSGKVTAEVNDVVYNSVNPTRPLMAKKTASADIIVRQKLEPSVVTINRNQLLVNGKPLTVKGVCYQPTPVGQGEQFYDWSQDPANYLGDFELLQAMGANTIRLYRPPTSVESMNQAIAHGLYVIMTYEIKFQTEINDPAVRQQLREGVRNMVRAWKDHPAVLCWSIGNETNANLAPGVTLDNWYNFLNELAGIAQAEDANHPVTSANVDFGARPLAPDFQVPNLDFWSIQIYRGKGLGSLFNEYKALSAKPVLLSEFGCDAWDTINQVENQQRQAEYLQAQWQDIEKNLDICFGGTVFEFSDDWSKHQYGWPDSIHDTEGFWSNPAYYDYDQNQANIQEEWWGITAIQSGTLAKTPRQAFNILKDLWNKANFIPGDTDGNGQLTIGDAVYLLNYMFIPGSPAPKPLESANVNGDTQLDLADAVYLLNYLFAGGPAPVE